MPVKVQDSVTRKSLAHHTRSEANSCLSKKSSISA